MSESWENMRSDPCHCPAKEPSAGENGKCKGPEVGTCLVCLTYSKWVSVPIPEGMRKKEGVNEVREITEDHRVGLDNGVIIHGRGF